MPAASKMGVTASLLPIHAANTGFGRMTVWRCAWAEAAIDFAAGGAVRATGARLRGTGRRRANGGGERARLGAAGVAGGVGAPPEGGRPPSGWCHPLGKIFGESPAEIRKPIHGEHADPAAVGED